MAPRCLAAAVPLVLLGACAPGFAQDLAPGQVEIALRAEVAPVQRLVRLGDVATIRGTDLETVRRLVQLPLGEAPRAGAPVLLEQRTVDAWIRRQLGIASSQLVWRGSERAAVAATAQRAEPADIERTARAALQQWLAARSSRFDIDSLGLPSGLALPAGRVSLAARPLAAGMQPASRMVVWVDVSVDGGFVRTVPVAFAVDAYRQAWVAASPVGADAPLGRGLVERREVALASRGGARTVHAAPVEADADDAAELRSVRALRAGEVLTADNTARALAVSRGEWVTLQLNTGAVQMEGRAEALQGGELGQTVRVRMARGSAPVQARIVARGRVEAMP